MRLVSAACLLLCACAADHQTWHGDVTFQLNERVAIERANLWMAARVNRTAAPIVWDAKHVSLGEHCSESGEIIRGGITIPGGGMFVHKEYCVYLSPAASPLDGTAAHEFGHSWGLGHLGDHTAGIMNPYVSPMIWTDADQKNCEEAKLCHSPSP